MIWIWNFKVLYFWHCLQSFSIWKVLIPRATLPLDWRGRSYHRYSWERCLGDYQCCGPQQTCKYLQQFSVNIINIMFCEVAFLIISLHISPMAFDSWSSHLRNSVQRETTSESSIISALIRRSWTFSSAILISPV